MGGAASVVGIVALIMFAVKDNKVRKQRKQHLLSAVRTAIDFPAESAEETEQVQQSEDTPNENAQASPPEEAVKSDTAGETDT